MNEPVANYFRLTLMKKIEMSFPPEHIQHYQKYYMSLGYDAATSYHHALSILQQQQTSSQQTSAQQSAPISNQQSNWPESLRAYVSRVFDAIPAGDAGARDRVSQSLRTLVNTHSSNGTLWTTDWTRMPLVSHSPKISSSFSFVFSLLTLNHRIGNLAR